MIQKKDLVGLKSRDYIDFECDYCGSRDKRCVKHARRKFVERNVMKIPAFCSSACCNSYHRKAKKIQKICEGCGITFEVPDIKKRRKQRFCSLKCANKHRHTEEINKSALDKHVKNL